MNSNIFLSFIIVLVVAIQACKNDDNSVTPIVPPTDTVPKTDWRAKYLGQYLFNVTAINYSVNQDSVYRDTLVFQYLGGIQIYQKDRLLVKYSANTPILRCVSGNGWYQGFPNDPFITNCIELYYVQNWVSPIIYSNDSLLLFKNYSRQNGSGRFYNNDSIVFTLELQEKMYGFTEHIKGKKVKN